MKCAVGRMLILIQTEKGLNRHHCATCIMQADSYKYCFYFAYTIEIHSTYRKWTHQFTSQNDVAMYKTSLLS